MVGESNICPASQEERWLSCPPPVELRLPSLPTSTTAESFCLPLREVSSPPSLGSPLVPIKPQILSFGSAESRACQAFVFRPAASGGDVPPCTGHIGFWSPRQGLGRLSCGLATWEPSLGFQGRHFLESCLGAGHLFGARRVSSGPKLVNPGHLWGASWPTLKTLSLG